MTIRRSLSCISAVFFAALLGTALHLAAQQPSQTTAAAAAPLPTFDVVAIHENKSPPDSMSVRWGGDAYVAHNITLADLVMTAHNLRPELISGLPGWADSFHFDLNAKISDPDADALKKLSAEQRRAMMVALIADRFRLRAHTVVKTLPVYDLVVAKGGSKLKENSAHPDLSSADPHIDAHNLKPGTMMYGPGQMVAVAIPISNLVATLAFQVQRNIIDKTGLTGKYDINLKFTPPEIEAKPDGLTDNPPPDLFTALQEQLGLKLEPSKGPVETLVVDHVEMPTEI